MYFTSELGHHRDVWAIRSAAEGSDQHIRNLQAAVNRDGTKTVKSFIDVSCFLIGFVSLVIFTASYYIAGSLDDWPADRMKLMSIPLMITGGCAIVMITFTLAILIGELREARLLERIRESRSKFSNDFITAEAYSFQSLFRKDTEWTGATNFAFCAAEQIIDEYFRKTAENDSIISRGGQDVGICQRSIDEAARKARAACTDDADNHKQGAADELDAVDFAPFYQKKT